MKFKLLLQLLLIVSILYGSEIALDKLNWIPSVNSSNQVSFVENTAKLTFNGKKSGEVGKSGVWFTVEPKTKIKLDPYKYLLFRARSTDGKNRSFTVYIKRELTDGDSASFYTIVELGTDWQDYNLRLQRGDRVNFGQGIFALAKISPGGSSDLSAGGTLTGFTFAVSEPAQIEMAALRLSNNPVDSDKEEIDQIVKEIKQRKKFTPYAIPNKNGAKIFTLAENGQSNYSINAAADSVSQFAAAELKKYLNAVTGANFNTASGALIQLRILDKEPADAFSLQVDEHGNIEITGNNGRGLVYAVYDFLERVAACRFFGPFDYLEVVPQHNILTVPEFSLSEIPQMNYRFPHYCNSTRTPRALEHIYAMADYCVKNRYNVVLQKFNWAYGIDPATQRQNAQEFLTLRGGVIPLPERWGHNFHIWLPPQKYFAEHPEYYCYDRASKQWRAERAQLCTTNPEVVQKLTNIALTQFRERPELTHFGVMQEDGHRLWCQCENCLKINPSGSNLHSATDNNLYLANAVAEQLGPNKRVMTYAYGVTASPPKAIKPLPNVDILYCQYGSDVPSQMPWEGAAAGEILKWTKLSDGNLNIYSYNYLTPFYTFPNAAAHIASFRYYNILGICGSTQEMSEAWSTVVPYQYYLSARLAWNPWFNEDEFRKDYFSCLYEKASESMEQLYLLLDKELSNKKNRVAINQWYSYTAIPNDALEQCRKLLVQAYALAEDKQRIVKAINAQAEGIKYLTAVSKALQAIYKYRLMPLPENRSDSVNAVNLLEKQAASMIENRLGHLGHISYLRQVIDEITQNAVNYNEMENKFKIIKNLDQGWKFAVDPESQGEKKKYFATDFDDKDWVDIKVGECWEKQGFPDYDGAGWYRVKLEVPTGDNLGFYFGAADERAWIYLDGEYIGGHHEGDIGKLWQEPFFIPIPGHIKAGTRQLTVKVIDSAGAGGLWKEVYLVSIRK